MESFRGQIFATISKGPIFAFTTCAKHNDSVIRQHVCWFTIIKNNLLATALTISRLMQPRTRLKRSKAACFIF